MRCTLCRHLMSFILYVSGITQTSVSASSALTTNSELGRTIISSARRLEDGDDDEVDYSWLTGYSLKFQGCHRIKTWNGAADEENEVKIEVTRLARFRLCPTDKCSQRTSSGCSKDYGDYIVDVYRYVSAYSQAQRKQDEYQCQSYLYSHCDCEDSDDKGDDFDKDICEYQCYKNGRKNSCIENNPYYDDEYQNQEYYLDDRTLEKYYEGCTQFSVNDDRRLEGDDDDEEVYYIGLYCADQGGRIYLGMFTDDKCTNFADKNAGRTTYKELTGGQVLPYSDYSMVRTDCVSCEDQEQEQHDEDQNDDEAEAEALISEACQEVYYAAGKCETQMADSGGPSTLSKQFCYYMEGIKIIRKDGIIDTSFSRPNKVASFFIFLFAVSFVLLGAIIYYFRMKLGMKLNLNS
mmetsp:Transcript_30398/g.36126  ORF Transcript_30398/g.36126 Transcript_30398/m.36126 type:complete len:406 (+) Transcript_30398:126-1343(+)